MLKLAQLSSKTIIIHPGSELLRIGLGVDEKPHVFLHCIARKSKTPVHRKTQSALTRYASIDYNASYEAEDARSRFLLGNVTFDIKLYNALNNQETHRVHIESDDLWIPFLRGFRQAGKGDFEIEWPMFAGRFNESISPKNVLQNLEDMWTFALENYLDIPKESFHKYSVILVIEDIFIRREVRQVVDMLIKELEFSRVIVQLASVCTTYGVGLPSACVVDLGYHKTSITCVDEGISLPDVRLTLPAGVRDCFRAFHAAAKHFCTDSALSSRLENLDDNNFEDAKTIFNALFDCDLVATKILQGPQHQNKPSDEPEDLTVKINIPPEHCLCLPISAALAVHMSPYFPWKANEGGVGDLVPSYQVSAIDAPEPDDPFDEVYIATTAREKKRRLPAGGDGILPKGEDGVSDPKVAKLQKPSAFSNLAEAVLWSINQVASVPSADAVVVDAPASSNAHQDEKAIQLRQRMLGCILLVGGGGTNLAGQLLERALYAELRKLVSGTGASVEVILRPEGVADLAWEGAKLMLNTDSIGDLWISSADWKRHGARVLRERAPFPW